MMENECFPKTYHSSANQTIEQRFYNTTDYNHGYSYDAQEYSHNNSFSSHGYSSCYSQDLHKDCNQQGTHYERIYEFNNNESNVNFRSIENEQCCEFHFNPHAEDQINVPKVGDESYYHSEYRKYD